MPLPTRSWLSFAPLLILSLASTAQGAWPSTPDAPLLLEGGFATGEDDPAVTITPDGATWIAWIDGGCFGSLRFQRISSPGEFIAPSSLVLDTRADCLARTARIAPCADASALMCGIAQSTSPQGTPVQRFSADGLSMWGTGVLVPEHESAVVGALCGLNDRDALIAWQVGPVIHIGRYDETGAAVWPTTASFAAPSGPNLRMIDLCADSAGGAYLVWDSPASYTRAVWTMRVTADGQAAWRRALLVVPVFPGSSRHTPPVATADEVGGLTIAWSEGRESADTPVPGRVQRISPDGQFLLDAAGARISLSGARQFHVAIERDTSSGDLFFVWRDGPSSTQTIRAQRMTTAGARLWGDQGVLVSPIGGDGYSSLDTAWTGSQLLVARAEAAGAAGVTCVTVRSVTPSGVVQGSAWPVSTALPAWSVRTPRLGDGCAVVWLQGNGFESVPAAQRLRGDGSLGAPLVTGDLDRDGTVGFGDLLILLSAWGACGSPCPADLDESGDVEFGDLLALLAAWAS